MENALQFFAKAHQGFDVMSALLRKLISCVTADGLSAIQTRIEGTLDAGQNLRIGYLNAQVCAAAQRHINLMSYVTECDILLPDGAPVAWLTGWFRKKNCDKVTVTDLLPSVLRIADDRSMTILLVGSAIPVQEAFVEMCASCFPRVRVSCIPVNVHETDPLKSFRGSTSLQSDILFVALGAPFQEDLLVRYRDSFTANIILTCGGAIDVLSGLKRRAPAWMHSIGVEWIYRLLKEPRRLFWRYLKTNIVFLGMFASTVWQRRTGA